MEGLCTFGGGEETTNRVFQDSSFSGFIYRSDFRRGEIKNFKQEKKRKESPGPLPPLEVSVRV